MVLKTHIFHIIFTYNLQTSVTIGLRLKKIFIKLKFERKIMKKKIITLFVTGMTVLSLSACGTTENSTENSTEISTENATENATETTSEQTISSEDAGPSANGGVRFAAGSESDGEANIETDPEIVAVIEEGSSKFEQFTFEDEETGISLEYSLYIPENYDENEEYPMIMYIPDASGASKTALEIVEQYFGADIWVTDEEQAKHASFVLVPAYPTIAVDDDWNTTDDIEATVNLINSLTENYSIDTDRLYTTGQSMGCMTSLYLNSKYPDLFAASLFVSGQWDSSVLEPLTEKKFFYVTAAGDSKASGGQDEVMAILDAANVGYSFGTWDAQDAEEDQSAAAQTLIAEGNDANFIRFEEGTVLTDGSGMEHNASFNYGYKISAVRDWLFEQTK